MKYLVVLAGLAALSACSAQTENSVAPEAPAEDAAPIITRAEAVLINRAREEIGFATFQQGPMGVVIAIEATGLSDSGEGQFHGAHLHSIGDCSNEDFTSSGGHINPSGAAHGLLHPEGPDNADLPNLWVHGDGTLNAQAHATLVSIGQHPTLPALLDEDGSALVIHANPDDMVTQPIGGAGPRIVCGVITAVEEG
jgi:Cu-Zn family superoxide dismutase